MLVFWLDHMGIDDGVTVVLHVVWRFRFVFHSDPLHGDGIFQSESELRS